MESFEVDVQNLPAGEDVVFATSPRSLPAPSEVRAQHQRQGGDVDDTSRPKPTLFPDLGIIVKWGSDVTIAEGQCLWFLGGKLSNHVPVPTIHGWKQDSGQTFLYMQLVEGDTLTDRWDGLAHDERVMICEQLSNIVSAYRQVKQQSRTSAPTPSSEESSQIACYLERLRSIIYSWWRGDRSPATPATNLPRARLSQVGGQALCDIMFQDAGDDHYPAGPFDTIEDFHKSFARLAKRGLPGARDPRKDDKALAGLRDDVPVVFTHADLDRSNILISKLGDGLPRIVAIIDWHQSGWYPEPWEWLKAQSIGVPGSEWVETYLNIAIKPAEYGYFYSWEYVSTSII